MGVFELSSFIEEYPEYKGTVSSLVRPLLDDPDDEVKNSVALLLTALAEDIRGQVSHSQEMTPPLIQSEIILDESLGYIPSLKVHVRFWDTNNEYRELGAFSYVAFSTKYMHIISRKLVGLLERTGLELADSFSLGSKAKRILKSSEIITFNEDNFFQIYDFAEKQQIKWYYLMNIRIRLEKISYLGILKGQQFSNYLWLIVETFPRPFVILFRKIKYDRWKSSGLLTDIESLISQYGRGESKKADIHSIMELLWDLGIPRL